MKKNMSNENSVNLMKPFLTWVTEVSKERCYTCLEPVKIDKENNCSLCNSLIKPENYKRIRNLISNGFIQ